MLIFYIISGAQLWREECIIWTCFSRILCWEFWRFLRLVFLCIWRVLQWLFRLYFGFWLVFGLWLSALDLLRVLTIGFRPVSVFDARFWLCLDSRFRPFSVFDARFWLCLDSRFRPFSVFDPRPRISSDWLIAPPSPPSFPSMEMGAIGVLSVCVSMRYAFSRLLTMTILQRASISFRVFQNILAYLL